MTDATNTFQQLTDNRGNLYFYYTPTDNVPILNTSLDGTTDLASFLDDSITVNELGSSIFSKDLTARDDVLIAFLTLFLLLTIEGIVTSLLLRTSNRSISIFGFSVKHMVELARDFRFHSLFNARLHRVNFQLLCLAFLFFGCTFALEVLVLFLTTPSSHRIYNSQASIRLRQPITPEWLQVRFHSRVSINRLCTALSMEGVEQGRTSISSCLTSSDEGRIVPSIFKDRSGAPPVNVILQSDVHRHGTEFFVRYGAKSMNYSARAYVALSDGKERLMSEGKEVGERNEEAMFHVHTTYIGFLLASYKKASKDEAITEDRLNEIGVTRTRGKGEDATVLRLPGRDALNVETERFTTEFTGVPDVGDTVALQYAATVFKASMGIEVTEGNKTDLFLGDGETRSEKAMVWGETARGLNWISLLLTLVTSVLILIGLRLWLKPASTADMAGVYVKGLVGAHLGRGPLQMADGEKAWFRIGPDDEEQYRFGAETDFRWKDDGDYEARV